MRSHVPGRMGRAEKKRVTVRRSASAAAAALRRRRVGGGILVDMLEHTGTIDVGAQERSGPFCDP